MLGYVAFAKEGLSMTEIDALVKILQRRIHEENIIFYEDAGYNNLSWYDKYIPIENYSYDKIKKAIEEDEDLNQFGEGKIYSDLNHFLKDTKKLRMMFKQVNLDTLFGTFTKDTFKELEVYFETHTEEENNQMKQHLLNKFGQKLENPKSNQIESVFEKWLEDQEHLTL